MRRQREPLDHPLLWVGIVGLYAISIPWWAGTGPPTVLFGFPSWAVVSLAATLGVSCLTAFAVLRLWEDESEDDGPTGSEQAPGGDAG